jgi:biopolymer transport protein ExbB/TolQ
MIQGNPFGTDSASDWWNFGVNVLIGLATVLALIVAITDSVRANRRARAADRRAEEAEEAQRAFQRLQFEKIAKRSEVKRVQLEAELAKKEGLLQVATDYDDSPRAQTLEGEIAELHRQLGEFDSPDD